MRDIRPAAVAGLFYPDDAVALAREVSGYLDGVPVPAGLHPKALVAPHAGYVYSGPVAARAYALLAPWRNRIRRVVLLGPAHRVWVDGLALPGVDAFETPLGQVPLDQAAIASLTDLPQVVTSQAAHAGEHALEVHLPFLQTTLDAFRLVPLVVGGASAEAVAEVLDRLWGGEETLIVVSSDLSHFHAHDFASRIDQDTARAILDLDPHLVGEQACGAHPLNGLLLTARRRGLKPRLLDLRNSGDTAGDRDRVVGYGAFAFMETGHGHDLRTHP